MICYCETSDEFEILDDIESDSIPDYSPGDEAPARARSVLMRGDDTRDSATKRFAAHAVVRSADLLGRRRVR